MRIVITADPEIEVPPRLYGGIERVVDGLVRRFRARGHQVCLVAKPGSECPADAFYSWPGASSLSASDSVRNAWALWKAARAFQPDVVHSFSRIAYLTPLLRGSTPIVMSYQRDPTMRTVGLAVKLAAPGVLRFTGCSEYIAGLGRQAGGEWEGIPNFAEMDALHFSPTVAPDAPLVFLSRVEHIKGAHWAIEIARRTGQRLIIAGNHSDTGPEGEYWREKIAPEIGRDGVEYVGAVNDDQKHRVSQKLASALGDLRGKRIALWGLAFKPRTDDMRDAPSLTVIDDLLGAGASVVAHDPIAMDEARRRLGSRITFAPDEYSALRGADALAVITDWHEYRHPDFEQIKSLLAKPIIVDGRNLYSVEGMKELGFTYHSIGRLPVGT